ncbi:aldo/keto reductase [Neobacillus notoginsengisoli]|uniref:Aldo/keto reductase n=1 Tax=Neobacillus notoginsengisoli TaxID=1578198 RepID=A0A417YVB5_9BACI|nr:aldo/keto reductase [Neobacillus notoginsengisoli]RHW41178.1 aldo/keto reductase [Neobacillus notoginsengisoli]
MRKNKLGNSSLEVSALGLGCMSLGTDLDKARLIIDAALDEGITYFDTADLYDFGENERIVGECLKGRRDKVIIATKAGNRWSADQSGWNWDPSKEHIKQAVKDSLKRLQTDYIDLYQLHGGTINDPIDETIEAFEELKAEGLIRYYGISSIRPNVVREYVDRSGMVSVMVQYSMLDRRPEEEILPLLERSGMSAVTRGTVAKGLLSGRMLEKASEKGFLDYQYEELRELLPALKEKLAARPLEEAAIQYNLAHPAVAAVVAGASSVEQVKKNASAVRAEPLSYEEISLIRELTKANVYAEHR